MQYFFLDNINLFRIFQIKPDQATHKKQTFRLKQKKQGVYSMENYVKQIIDFQKTTFDNTYNTITQIQDQAEKLALDVIGQMPWMPEEGKKAFDNSLKMYKNAREDYKKLVSEGFSKMEEPFV
jgi:hypothetical protein